MTKFHGHPSLERPTSLAALNHNLRRLVLVSSMWECAVLFLRRP